MSSDLAISVHGSDARGNAKELYGAWQADNPYALRYRPEIDGLRAVAVLAVVCYHARLGCAGGYVGVDVFFVISGFLIPSLIFRATERSSFHLADFWERRIR